MKKTLILVTGPIGAGKSTFIEMMLHDFPFDTIEYISADLYLEMYFQRKKHLESENYTMAKEYCWYKLNKAISEERSFIWETVVAKEDKINFLKKCSNLGYRIITIFISVNDPKLLLDRVLKRHVQGWYNIPQNKIESRFSMVIENLETLLQLSDEFIAIDSSNGYKVLHNT